MPLPFLSDVEAKPGRLAANRCREDDECRDEQGAVCWAETCWGPRPSVEDASADASTSDAAVADAAMTDASPD